MSSCSIKNPFTSLAVKSIPNHFPMANVKPGFHDSSTNSEVDLVDDAEIAAEVGTYEEPNSKALLGASHHLETEVATDSNNSETEQLRPPEEGLSREGELEESTSIPLEEAIKLLDTGQSNVEDSCLNNAPLPETIATDQLFDKILELHKLYNRDITILIHNKDNQSKSAQFHYWGSPGPGEQFLDSSLGSAIKDAWQAHMVQSTTTEDSTQSNLSATKPKKERAVERSIKRLRLSHALTGETKSKAKKSRGNVTISAPRATGRKKKLNQHPVKRERNKPSRRMSREPSQKQKSPNGNVYVVEKLLDKRTKDRSSEYLVKWAGWSNKFNTWEPEKNIFDKSLIRCFNKQHKMMLQLTS